MFNVVTQQDSAANVDIAIKMAHDSSSIKAITILTMIFLPGTFVGVGLDEYRHIISILNYFVGNILERSLWGGQIGQDGTNSSLLAVYRSSLGVDIDYYHPVVLSSVISWTAPTGHRRVETSSECCIRQ